MYFCCVQKIGSFDIQDNSVVACVIWDNNGVTCVFSDNNVVACVVFKEEKAKAHKKEKRKERKRKVDDGDDGDPDMAALMGFSGFGTSKKANWCDTGLRAVHQWQTVSHCARRMHRQPTCRLNTVCRSVSLCRGLQLLQQDAKGAFSLQHTFIVLVFILHVAKQTWEGKHASFE